MAEEKAGRIEAWNLELDGITEGRFREVSGISSSSEVIEHRFAGKTGLTNEKVPGQLKFTNLVLRRGITDDTKLHDWFKLIQDNKMASTRKNGSLTLMDYDGNTVVKFSFTGSWPTKFKGPALDASKSEIGVEEMEIVVQTLTRDQ